MKRDFKAGDIVQHFKRDLCDDKTKYLYEIVCVANHTETDEKLVIYKPFPNLTDSGIYARPYEMFISRVDKVKYPDAKQEYRFEKIGED